uniref:phosphatidylserine decarboxylase n=1 Tax=Eutreptiella gymnastica TaxID=73025 RepID=A0A7S4FDZ2_9EUGL
MKRGLLALLGLAVPSAWVLHVNHDISQGKTISETDLYFLSHLPLRKFSRVVGFVNETQFPSGIQNRLIKTFASLYGINLEECERDWQQYTSMQEFFTRALKAGARPIDHQAALVSPADGVVLQCGVVGQEGELCIKGVPYDEREFVQEDASIPAPLQRGTQRLFCIIYLAPGDYHRFHSPATWRLCSYTHISGHLYSVHPLAVKWLTGLFCLNERVVLKGKWQFGKFIYAPVGATNVGSMAFVFDKKLHTNIQEDDVLLTGSKVTKNLDCPVTFLPGDELGTFRMGSSVVLIFDAPKSLEFCVSPHQKVRMGQPLVSWGKAGNGPFARWRRALGF